jgi:hypothetical protein
MKIKKVKDQDIKVQVNGSLSHETYIKALRKLRKKAKDKKVKLIFKDGTIEDYRE